MQLLKNKDEINSNIFLTVPTLQGDFRRPIYKNDFVLIQTLEQKIINFIEKNPKCITSEIIDNFVDEEISNVLEILNKLESDPTFSVKFYNPQ